MPSWITGANTRDSHFPIQNLPYGVAQRTAGADNSGNGSARCVVAIGDSVVDLHELHAAGLLDTGSPEPVFAEPSLNAFMATGPDTWRQIRNQLTGLLNDGNDRRLRDDRALREKAVVPMSEVSMQMPFNVAEYTDFYAGRQHATNVGTIFRVQIV